MNAKPDAIVRCEICGREDHVRFASCIANGWPKCHERTMPLIRPPDNLQAASDEAVRRLLPR
ncbi:MAG TPA: hypothetical protein VJ874_01130 [Candidatus Thermoplasmatota archaeon]|nr:hypothetical protein [Candidatus Thermoplasmatota archaeon]